MHLTTIRLLAISGLYLASTSASPVARRAVDQVEKIDFNAMFNGSLGTLPAMWLVSQGALAAFKTANSTHVVQRQDEQRRTDLENGAVMAAFISSMLTLPIKIHDEGVANGVCEALSASASGMGSAIVSQESGKKIFSGNSTDDDWEQGAIPGGVVGGAFGAVVGTTLSKTICNKLKKGGGKKPDLPNRPDSGLLKDLIESPTRILGDAACVVMNELLAEVGMDIAQRMHLAQQLRELLQLTELHGLARTVQHLTREMTRQIHALSDLVADAAGLAAAEAALASLASLAVESTAVLGIVQTVPLRVPSNPALENLQIITLHLSGTLELVASLPETAALAKGLRSGVYALRDQVDRQIQEQDAEDPKEEGPEVPKEEDSEHPKQDEPENDPLEDEEPVEDHDNVDVAPPPPPPPKKEPPPPIEECKVIKDCLWIFCVDRNKCP
ncbi:uncharacterized protein EKO05_0002683 [Ascochyta rabiei]|uniref:Uncharacterized protein n=1 Tax=Didymella rabiei TaxID=5454 RepID=A0A163GLD4_DIDRA|nr:uncharacterized protein EKO05_0002683 [Ascochyta rabiei]KZM24908.1 hypothetical protein ST47_g3933 [Ascochyta rabiei]UPX12112.1 hypothetical protein EKO05_0002683 [Ascochyta rabiei]